MISYCSKRIYETWQMISVQSMAFFPFIYCFSIKIYNIEQHTSIKWKCWVVVKLCTRDKNWNMKRIYFIIIIVIIIISITQQFIMSYGFCWFHRTKCLFVCRWVSLMLVNTEIILQKQNYISLQRFQWNLCAEKLVVDL